MGSPLADPSRAVSHISWPTPVVVPCRGWSAHMCVKVPPAGAQTGAAGQNAFELVPKVGVEPTLPLYRETVLESARNHSLRCAGMVSRPLVCIAENLCVAWHGAESVCTEVCRTGWQAALGPVKWATSGMPRTQPCNRPLRKPEGPFGF